MPAWLLPHLDSQSQQADYDCSLPALRLKLQLQGDISGANSKTRKAKDLREQISGLEFKLETAQTAASELSKLGNNGAASGAVLNLHAEGRTGVSHLLPSARQPSTI